jgi:hypothetical protein
MTVWAYLLSKGDLGFLAEPLSSFRIHAGQEQQQPGAEARGAPALEQLRALWRAAGGHIPGHPALPERSRQG